jgi:hypothetical protein
MCNLSPPVSVERRNSAVTLRQTTVDRAEEYWSAPLCSKFRMTEPIVSEPADQSSDDSVSSVKMPMNTMIAPLNIAGHIRGRTMHLQQVNVEEPLTRAES